MGDRGEPLPGVDSQVKWRLTLQKEQREARIAMQKAVQETILEVANKHGPEFNEDYLQILAIILTTLAHKHLTGGKNPPSHELLSSTGQRVLDVLDFAFKKGKDCD